MVTAPELEIAVLVLGMVILMFEAFTTKIDKKILALAAIVGLALVLIASFFVARSQPPEHLRTNQHPRQYFAHNSGLSETFEDFRQQLRRREDQQHRKRYLHTMRHAYIINDTRLLR